MSRKKSNPISIRRFKWFATGEKSIAVGARLALTGTVKAHAEFKGSPETVLTRCKIM